MKTTKSIFVPLVFCLVLLVVLPVLGAQAQDPWFGTWRLNFARSTADRDQQFKKVTSRIEPYEDGLKVTYDLVGTRGGIIHMEWTGKFDGKDYPVQGVDYSLTNAYTLVDDHNYEIVLKSEGMPVGSAHVQVSADGKILTAITTERG